MCRTEGQGVAIKPNGSVEAKLHTHARPIKQNEMIRNASEKDIVADLRRAR